MKKKIVWEALIYPGHPHYGVKVIDQDKDKNIIMKRVEQWVKHKALKTLID